jgi:hypothetical protein
MEAFVVCGIFGVIVPKSFPIINQAPDSLAGQARYTGSPATNAAATRLTATCMP